MRFKKMFCLLTCAAMLTMSVSGSALAAGTATDVSAATETAASVSRAEGDNITHSGDLTIEAHLQARMGYPVAYYKVLIYAPSNVVGIQINDMDILTANSVQLNGGVKEIERGTGIFESITVKVTLYYADRAPHVSYETINVNHWCGAMHPVGPNCTP